MSCSQCEQLRINGIVTHEQGCPDVWRDQLRECLYCGCKFKPVNQWHIICDQECNASYWGS